MLMDSFCFIQYAIVLINKQYNHSETPFLALNKKKMYFHPCCISSLGGSFAWEVNRFKFVNFLTSDGFYFIP